MAGFWLTRRSAAIAGTGAALIATSAGGALAAHKGKITPVTESHASATLLARAMTVPKGLLFSGRFAAVPPDHHPNAVSTKPLAGFPRRGSRYAILTTGCASLADHKKGAGLPGCLDNGVPFRGTKDLTILRVTTRVPKSANCLSFRFKFLSQEFPKFVGSPFNDGFIAEMDKTSWSAGENNNINDPHINAPNDFATDPKGNIISINATGPASMSAANARGTTYGGATPPLRASTPVKPGIHSLFLSIFDQGDRQYDSAVFLDQLTVNHQPSCKSGIAKTK